MGHFPMSDDIMPLEHGLYTGKGDVRVARQRIRYFFECRESMRVAPGAPALKTLQEDPPTLMVGQIKCRGIAVFVDPVVHLQLGRDAPPDPVIGRGGQRQVRLGLTWSSFLIHPS